MSYGGYNPKAKVPSGSSQDASTSATGRKFAVMPKKLGGLGYSKPPPKPAAASQAPIVPDTGSSSSITAKRETPSPPQENHQPMQHPSEQQRIQVHPDLQPPMQPQWQHTYAQPRPTAIAARPVMPAMRLRPALGYATQVQKPVMSRVGMGYGAGTSYNSNLSLDVPLREPSPEPVIIQEVVVRNAPIIVDDYPYYGSFQDIDIQVKNVVCAYNLPLHIDLRRYALQTSNVTLERGRGVLLKQLRHPMCYTKIYSSGKIYIVGCKSEEEAMRAARCLARSVQKAMNKLGDELRMRNYRVCNILATCKMPFGIKVEEVAMAHPAESQYEPELSVGLVWRNKEPKATLRIHTTGSVTVTGAQSVADVYTVIELIYPILLKHRCHPKAKGPAAAAKRKRDMAAMKKETARFMSRLPAKMSRSDSAIVYGRVVFSDEEDIYDDEYLY